MGFKESVARDIAKVFLNTDEFANTHTIKFDGEVYKDIPVVIQQNEQSERDVLRDDHMRGIYMLSARVYFSAKDTGGNVPEQGKIFEINDGEALGKPFFVKYRVETSENIMGLVRLNLTAYRE